MNDLFFNYVWLSISLWVLFYSLDYFLTIWGAKYYYGGINEKLLLEKSYEMNPAFRKEVTSLKYLSFKFISTLLIIGAAIPVAKYGFDLPQNVYNFFLGMIILPEVFVLRRHISNLHFFKNIDKSYKINGTVEISHSFSVKATRIESFYFSAIYLLLFFMTVNFFFLGGSLHCLFLGCYKWK